MSKKIDKLTPEQEEIAKKYVEKYTEIAGTTGLCDRDKARKAFQAFYDYKNYGKIKEVIWFDDPISAATFCAKGIKARQGIDPIACRDEIEAIEVNSDEIKSVLERACYGSAEAYWVCFYVFCRDELKLEDHPLIDICDNICKETGVAWFFENYVVASERPLKVTRKGVEYQSIGDEPAIVFPNGRSIYAHDGKRYNTLIEMRLAQKGIL
jgi:hypothetical protein